ncbi:MAG TPA: aminopeptidase [Bacteroidia bacterium]|nr:aminopeptidase [Bacteroidia bacterium]
MFRLIRFVLSDALLLLLFLFLCAGNQLVLYGLAQGKGQLNIVMNTRQVSDVMKDPAFPDSLKQKLVLIQEVKKFATDSLGLKPSDNYSTIYEQHNKPALWTITASEPFKLKAKEWWFPFLGSVSYKGFFDYAKGKKEADQLVAEGYDVDYGPVSGWSTLGWFKDPILSGMLRRDAGHIADLIIHELTHGTIYLKNKVDFNENLANFIGDKGAERFLIYKYGIGSAEYQEYIHSKSDRRIYNEYILHAADQLDSLYRSFQDHQPLMEKEKKKMALIYETIAGLDKLPLYHKKGYQHYTQDAIQIKNAFFMSFRRYDSQYDVFEKEFREQCHSDIRFYIRMLIKRIGIS